MSERIVYVIQEVAGTQAGNPKINIMGASHYGQFKFVLPEFSQMIHSPGPLVYTLRQKLKDYKSRGFFVIGEPVSILLYLASLPTAIIFLVLRAEGVLIVVDSSTAIKVL